MPLLADIGSDYVYKGWWRNLTAPTYRQYLWTATNMEALVFLGLLGILGTIAGDKLWPIIRHFLQPAVQLVDLENKRLKLSRNDAIKAIWVKANDMRKGLKEIWTEEHGVGQKFKISLDILSANNGYMQRQMDTITELRFGIFAILNIICFFILGIFLPFFLAEGLQGETIVQAAEEFQKVTVLPRKYTFADERMRASVNSDFERCVDDRGCWSQSNYCLDLRNNLPSYKTEYVNLTETRFANSPYRFLVERGDANFVALRLSRNTSYQDLGFNTEATRKTLLHELTCIPASLERFIAQVNGCFELRVEGIIPSGFSNITNGTWATIHDSMILRTSNTVGSGRELYRPRLILGNVSHPQTTFFNAEPVNNCSGQGAIWSQTNVDAVLPWISLKDTEDSKLLRALIGAVMLDGSRSGRLQSFFITFKPAESYGFATNRSDDPIFGAHSEWSPGQYIADREISALACTEIFKLCSVRHCTERPLGLDDYDGFLDYCYPGIMSVWVSALIESIYASHSASRQQPREFFSSLPNHRQRWQEDIGERFIRSMLRVRYASAYAAEQNLIENDPSVETFLRENYNASSPLLYRSSDYTNINVWGFVATAGGYLYIIAASYWLVLLAPLTMPVKFLARAPNLSLEKFKAMIHFGRIWFHGVNTAILRFVKVDNAVKPHQTVTPNTLSMDTWHTSQGNDEIDKPPKMINNHEVGAIV